MHLAEIVFKKEGSIKNIAMVKQPAIEVGVTKLADEKPVRLSYDDDQQIITGPVLIPDKKIWRNADFFGVDNEGGYIYFSKDTIRDIGTDFLNNTDNAISLEHDELVKKGDVKIMEFWYVEGKNDKAYSDKYGYSASEIPEGTLMMSQKIENDELWKQCKAGKFNGFSIDGKFGYNLIMSKECNEDEVASIIVDIIKDHINGKY